MSGDAINWLMGRKVTEYRVWVWLVFALIGLALLCLPFAGCYGLSTVVKGEGYRDSTVRKLSRTGYIWKSWEVETLGDGMRAKADPGGATAIEPETFKYTVRDPAAVEQLQALPPGQRVRLYYKSHAATWLPRGESSYEITRVEIVP